MKGKGAIIPKHTSCLAGSKQPVSQPLQPEQVKVEITVFLNIFFLLATDSNKEPSRWINHCHVNVNVIMAI